MGTTRNLSLTSQSGFSLLAVIVGLGLAALLVKTITDAIVIGMHGQKHVEIRQDVTLARPFLIENTACLPTYPGCGVSAAAEQSVDLLDSSGKVIAKADGTTKFGNINIRAMCRTEGGQQLLRLEFGRIDSKTGKPLDDPLTGKPAAFKSLYPDGAGPCLENGSELAEQCEDLGGKFNKTKKRCEFASDFVAADFQDKFFGFNATADAQRALVACGTGRKLIACNRSENQFARKLPAPGATLGDCRLTAAGQPRTKTGTCIWLDQSKGDTKKFPKTNKFAAGQPRKGWAVQAPDGTKAYCVGGVYHSTEEPVPEWVSEELPGSTAVSTCRHNGIIK